MYGQDGKRIMHCQLEINGGALMLSDNFVEYGLPPTQRSASYVMQLVLADGDAWWERAIKAGCKEKMPFALAPWGDKYGQMADPFGVTWAINTPGKKSGANMAKLGLSIMVVIAAAVTATSCGASNDTLLTTIDPAAATTGPAGNTAAPPAETKE